MMGRKLHSVHSFNWSLPVGSSTPFVSPLLRPRPLFVNVPVTLQQEVGETVYFPTVRVINTMSPVLRGTN